MILNAVVRNSLTSAVTNEFSRSEEEYAERQLIRELALQIVTKYSCWRHRNAARSDFARLVHCEVNEVMIR
jgi:hypothetical protein